jgi:hypothetical protein
MKHSRVDPAADSLAVIADPATMMAIVHDQYATAADDVLRLAEVSRPSIGDGEVLVRVHAASVDRGHLAHHDRTALCHPGRAGTRKDHHRHRASAGQPKMTGQADP